MSGKIFHVLFLCAGNSARSIMAEAILNRLCGSRFRAYSAGSHPAREFHPYAVDLLNRLGQNILSARPKSWDEFTSPQAPRMDFVFTVCDRAANEECPVWPGRPITAHWSIPDPAAATGTEAEKRLAFADAYRMISNRISLFLALPIESLDRIALKIRLDEIGRLFPKAG